MAAGGVTLDHAVAVSEHLHTDMAVKTAAFGIGDALIGLQRGLLCAGRHFDRPIRIEIGRMIQIEIRRVEGQQLTIRRTGKRIRGGEFGDINGRLHGAFDRIRAKIGRGRAAFAVLMIDGDAEGTIAVEFYIFHFAKACADANAGGFGHRDFRPIGADFCQFECCCYRLFEGFTLFCNLGE